MTSTLFTGVILSYPGSVMLTQNSISDISIPLPVDEAERNVVFGILKATKLVWDDVNTTEAVFRVKSNIKTTYDLEITFMGRRNITFLPFFNTSRVTSQSPGAASSTRRQLFRTSNVEYEVTVESAPLLLKFTYAVATKDVVSLVDISMTFINSRQISTRPVQPTLLSSSSVDTRIFILAVMETIFGQNLSLALFRSARGEWLHRPRFTSVVRGKECTLVGKYATQELRGAVPTLLEEYGLLRYFLWFILTGAWDITILLQSRTKEFFLALRNSSYRIWLLTFKKYRGYELYFKQ